MSPDPNGVVGRPYAGLSREELDRRDAQAAEEDCARSCRCAWPVGRKNGEWPAYGGDTGHTRYSPLDQINADNFRKLTVAWR
jgi:glucose dehydrogenase